MPSLPALSTYITIGVDFLLQGVLCAQFAHYTNVNQRDSVWMKLFVAGLALLTAVKTAQVFAMISTQNATLSENLQAAHQRLAQMNLTLAAGIALYVQFFFCHRLWTLSHNVYIIVVAISLFISAVVAASLAAYFFKSRSTAGLLISLHLGLAMGGDILQTGSIMFYLLRHSKTVIRQGPTASMLSSLLRLTIQAIRRARGIMCVGRFRFYPLFPTIRVINDTLNGVCGRSSSQTVCTGSIELQGSIMLPKLYAMAAMWTLNSRDEIRSAANAIEPPTHLDLPSFRGMNVGGTSAGSQSTNSVNGPENIQLNCAEQKARKV
ncbi:hypothetical protein C8F04DRAFT_1259219 [Mycena alexandri]|uniref:Uncharacterized protein n=1 Tax=Mycena alexandri TaxID=1745969 RepID=A0AAD6X7N5_9AGAR|nr:hypothetical protein C8F04DRAFT_1259219 [Mycena alexandri]